MCALCPPDEIPKMRFMLEALGREDPFVCPKTMPGDVSSAIEWQAARTPEEVRQARQQILDEIVAQAEGLRLGCVTFCIILNAGVRCDRKTYLRKVGRRGQVPTYQRTAQDSQWAHALETRAACRAS